ncbi:hypothetical protein Tco_1219026, partial [Tanacetum coccineum]
MDMDCMGDLGFLDPELLQLNEVSPLAIKSNHYVIEKLFAQWLSLPETTLLVIVILLCWFAQRDGAMNSTIIGSAIDKDVSVGFEAINSVVTNVDIAKEAKPKFHTWKSLLIRGIYNLEVSEDGFPHEQDRPRGELSYGFMFFDEHDSRDITKNELEEAGNMFVTDGAPYGKPVHNRISEKRSAPYAFDEAFKWASAHELRALFAHVPAFCEISDPDALWSKKWRRMSDGIQQRAAADLHIVNLHVNDGELQNYVLYELEMLLSSNSNSLSLSE